MPSAREIAAGARSSIDALTDAEEAFIEATLSNRPHDAGGARVRAAVIRWLCVDPTARAAMPATGIRLSNAAVTGALDLMLVSCPRLGFLECEFEDEIDLHAADVPYLDFAECGIADINASDARILSAVLLLSCRVTRGVDFSRARVGAQVVLDDTRFEGGVQKRIDFKQCRVEGNFMATGVATKASWFFATAMTVGGDVSFAKAKLEGPLFLDNSRVTGTVSFEGGFRSSERVSAAGISCQMLVARGARFLAPTKSLVIDAATISGTLSLEGIRARQVSLVSAKVGEQLDLEGARVCKRGGHAVVADGAVIATEIILDKACVVGRIGMVQTKVGSDFSVVDSRLRNRGGIAVALTAAVIENHLRFRDSRIDGSVQLPGAQVRGLFSMVRTRLQAGEQDAVNAFDCSVGRSVRFIEADVEGMVDFTRARIGGQLEFPGSTFRVEGDIALSAWGATVGGTVTLTGIKCIGRIVLSRVQSAAVTFKGSDVSAPGRRALDLERASVGDVILENSRINGVVFLDYAEVRGVLRVDKLRIKGGTIDAVRAKFANVNGYVAILNSRMSGAVDVSGTNVAGDFAMRNSLFSSRGRNALTGLGCVVKGMTELTDCRVRGRISLESARIEGDCHFDEVLFSGSQRGLALTGGTVLKRLIWTNIRGTGGSSFNLSLILATVGTLIDDVGSWPAQGNFSMAGFRYTLIAEAPIDTATRLAWIARQTDPAPESYEQLMRFYQLIGQEQLAKTTAIAKHRALGRRAKKWTWTRIASTLAYATIGYGWRPQWAVGWSVLMIALGSLLFANAHSAGVLVPTDEKAIVSYVEHGVLPPAYPQLQSVAYSADVFLPLLDLQQEKHWRANVAARCSVGGLRGVSCGWWVQLYSWLQSFLGWILTSLAVAGLTGLIRRA